MDRIVLVNKFYYNRGGDCVAVLNTEQLLKANGHEVAIFSMKYDRNLPSAWESYFPDEINFSTRNPLEINRTITRLFKPKDVAKQFNKLLDDFKPDVVHLHNIHSYISPVVAEIAHQKGIRVVWTLHDYKLICPAYSCLRRGVTCEYCFTDKSKILKNKCLKNSYIASLFGWLEAIWWNQKRLINITDLFVCPSRFLQTNMLKAGFPAEKITVAANFMPQLISPAKSKKDYYCYVGRISEEKGVYTLLKAAEQLPYPLKVIGDGPLFEHYRKEFGCEKIEFSGYLTPDKVFEIVKHARFMVLPSICYENNPLSVIEALCAGTPVLGARIGGIPELIEENVNGFLFSPQSIPELTQKIDLCFNYFHDGTDFEKIAAQAQNKFGSESFYRKLLNIYDRQTL